MARALARSAVIGSTAFLTLVDLFATQAALRVVQGLWRGLAPAARAAACLGRRRYLAAYFLGGLAGAALLGALYDGLGWEACVAGIGIALAAAAGLAARLQIGERTNERTTSAYPSPR